MPLTSRRRARTLVSAALLAPALGCSEAGPPGPVLEGELRQFIVDYENGEHYTGYALRTPGGEYVELDFSSTVAPEPGDFISVVAGKAVDKRARRSAVATVGDELVSVERVEVLQRARELNTLRQPIVTGDTTVVKVAAVLLNFNGVTAQSFSKTDADNRLQTVKGYYDELSYGTWDVQGASFGPYSVDKPANCNLNTIVDLAKAAASNNGVDIDSYDHVAVTLPSNDASQLGCACGLAWVGRTPAQGSPSLGDGSLYTCTDANAFAHEIGHGFGLHHAATADCDGVPYKRDGYSTCSVAEYGNQFNTMGNGLGHMNAFQKSTMQWLDDCNNVLVTKDATFDLVPIQLPSDDVQSLQIDSGDTRDGNPLYYWVEYRNPALADYNAGGGTPREKGSGVHVDVAPDFRVDDGDRRPLLLDLSTTSVGDYTDPRLTAGRSFSDPDGRVTISVVSATSDKATVQVSFPGGGSGVNLCVDGSFPPGAGDPPPAMLYQHCAYGGWYSVIEPGEYTTADLVALGAFDNDASSLRLSEGYEADLFDGDNFTGDSVTLTASSECLVDHTFNDTLSSLRIRALDVGGEGGAGGEGGLPGAGGSAGSLGGSATGGSGGSLGGSAGSTASGASSGNASGGSMPQQDQAPLTQPPLDAGCACATAGAEGLGARAPLGLWFALSLLGVLARRRARR